MISGNGIGMITILRNNKKLLRRKRFFNKERTFLRLKSTYAHDAELATDLIIDVATIRQERIKAKARSRKKTIMSVLAVIVACGATVVVLFLMTKLTVKPLQLRKSASLNEAIIHSLYSHFIQAGIAFKKTGDYDLAIIEFNKALIMNPILVDAHFAIYKTYGEQCSTFGEKCEESALKKVFLDKEYPEVGLYNY